MKKQFTVKVQTNIVWSESDIKKIKEAAEKKGLSFSSFVRLAVLERMDKDKE